MKKSLLALAILTGGLLLMNPTHEVSFAQENSKTSIQDIQQKTITQDDAKHLLTNFNNKVNYIYQGPASNFETLKEKGLQGYVFLPNIETDMGYFVDQNTSNIYYFHPSGYLEVAK